MISDYMFIRKIFYAFIYHIEWDTDPSGCRTGWTDFYGSASVSFLGRVRFSALRNCGVLVFLQKFLKLMRNCIVKKTSKLYPSKLQT